jgi:dipeptidyl-peptidase-4
MQFKKLVALSAFLIAAAPAPAADLTLERVFGSPSLSGPSPRLPKLSPDGRLATLLRNRADDKDRYDLWAVDTATGQARMLVDSLKLGTGAEISEEEKMRRERARIAGTKGITAYQWSPDGRALLVPLDGDLYVASSTAASAATRRPRKPSSIPGFRKPAASCPSSATRIST